MKQAIIKYEAPKKLIVKSDGNELEYIGIESLKSKDVMYQYKFTKSKTKLNKTMTISESELEGNLRKGIFKIM